MPLRHKHEKLRLQTSPFWEWPTPVGRPVFDPLLEACPAEHHRAWSGDSVCAGGSAPGRRAGRGCQRRRYGRRRRGRLGASTVKVENDPLLTSAAGSSRLAEDRRGGAAGVGGPGMLTRGTAGRSVSWTWRLFGWVFSLLLPRVRSGGGVPVQHALRASGLLGFYCGRGSLRSRAILPSARRVIPTASQPRSPSSLRAWTAAEASGGVGGCVEAG